MGKQVQIRLSHEAEHALIESLISKFPHCRIVNSIYPPEWDKQRLFKTEDAKRWLIIDSRAESVLIDSATVTDSGEWVVRSLALSCTEWTRDMEVPDDRGRLYLSTTGDPIWLDVSAETGDNNEKMFNHARRWIQRKCIREGKRRFPTWVG